MRPVHRCPHGGILADCVISAGTVALGTHAGERWWIHADECLGCGRAWSQVTRYSLAPPGPRAIDDDDERRAGNAYGAMYGARWDDGRVVGIDRSRVGEG